MLGLSLSSHCETWSFIDSAIGCLLQSNYQARQDSECVWLKWNVDRHINSQPQDVLTCLGWIAEWELWPRQDQCYLNINHPLCCLLLSVENFPLLTVPKFRWNPRGYHVREAPGSHSEMAFWGRVQGRSPSLRLRVSWDYVKQQVRVWGPGLVAEWWNWEIYRARQKAQRKLSACPCRCLGTWRQFLGLI